MDIINPTDKIFQDWQYIYELINPLLSFTV